LKPLFFPLTLSHKQGMQQDLFAFGFAAGVAAASVPSAAPRGRPVAGAGSHGGSATRDKRSRQHTKRHRSTARAQHDDEHAAAERKRSHRTNWADSEHQERLREAIKLCQQQGHTLRAAAALTDVPFAVLQRRASGAVSLSATVGQQPCLTSHQEHELVQFALAMADRGFGQDVGQLRDLARAMSQKSSFKATTSWWRRFVQRHPELARRRAQGYERLRASAMNSGVVKQYFLLLASAYAKVKELSGGMALTADRIYNMDEIGFQLNGVHGYIVTRKGTKHAASLAFNSRVTTSLAVCVSASGFVQPPFFIVKGLRRPAKYLDAAPEGSTFEMAKKGMMTAAVFAKWVSHFISHMEERHPTHWSLLLLDGHHSHTMNPGILRELWQHRVYAISLPSHTTAQLQLLDVAVFAPLKRSFRRWVGEWKLLNPLERLEKGQVPLVVGGIWNSISVETIKRGAASTGLYPLNSNWAAENLHKMQMAQTFHQLPLPGTISFANYTKCTRSLAALDLAMSPEQLVDLRHRIAATSNLPRLNALGESMAQARLLNSERRVEDLFRLQDSRKAALDEKAAKKRQRDSRKAATAAKKLQKLHARDAQRQTEGPLIEALLESGHLQHASMKPTVGMLRKFAKTQNLKPGSKPRAEIIGMLLEHVQTRKAAGLCTWKATATAQGADESSDEAQSELSESEQPSSSPSDGSDSDNWNDFAIRF
jgi:hypothetical protein